LATGKIIISFIKAYLNTWPRQGGSLEAMDKKRYPEAGNCNLMPLKILHVLLMLFCSVHGRKCAQVAAFICFRILLYRVQPVFAGF
jgi:hypothetical protein